MLIICRHTHFTLDKIVLCVKCKVVAIVMLPRTYNNETLFGPKVHILNSNFEQLSISINQMCNLPAFIIDNDLHMNTFTSLIEEYLSNSMLRLKH